MSVRAIPAAAAGRPDVKRLRDFVSAMIPIAIAYMLGYGIAAVTWDDRGLGGGAAAVALYLGALMAARRYLATAEVARAAVTTGSGLLAMLAVGALFVPWQAPALVLIAVAAVVVVIPHLSRRALTRFATAAILVTLEIVVVRTAVSPLFAPPPPWFQHVVLASAVLAATLLIVIMLAADHERMRALVAESEANAAAAREARGATEAFLIAAAHQFRTPIATLLLQSEALLGRGGELPARDRQRLERLVRAASRLRFLVDSMLELSRINAGTLSVERRRVEVAALVREVLQVHASAAADAGSELDVHTDDGATALADPARVELVASSLLEHALGAGAGQPVKICVRVDHDDIVLTVTDGGPGLAADGDRIFEPRRGERDQGNLGIGLWLVRELTRAMGGQVAAAAAPGAGTTFVVRLPRSES